MARRILRRKAKNATVTTNSEFKTPILKEKQEEPEEPEEQTQNANTNSFDVENDGQNNTQNENEIVTGKSSRNTKNTKDIMDVDDEEPSLLDQKDTSAGTSTVTNTVNDQEENKCPIMSKIDEIETIKNTKPEEPESLNNESLNAKCSFLNIDDNELEQTNDENATIFTNISWSEQNSKAVHKFSSSKFKTDNELTAKAVFIGANSKSAEEFSCYKSEKELYTTISKCYKFAREYCDLVISVSDFNKSTSQIYCSSLNLLARASNKLKTMLMMAKKRQSTKSERFCVVPVPAQYTYKIIRIVIEYLNFGTLKIPKDISFEDMQRMIRCFEYFKILSTPGNEVLPIIRLVCQNRQITFAINTEEYNQLADLAKNGVATTNVIQMKFVTSHIDKMYSKSYYIDASIFRKRSAGTAHGHSTMAMRVGHVSKNGTNSNSFEDSASPAKRLKMTRKNSSASVGRDFDFTKEVVPSQEKVSSRSEKFGGQTEDNKELIRKSQSRFNESSSCYYRTNTLSDTNKRKFPGVRGGLSRRSMPRNFGSDKYATAIDRVEAKILARRSQARDFDVDVNQSQQSQQNINPNPSYKRRVSRDRFSSKPIPRSRNDENKKSLEKPAGASKQIYIPGLDKVVDKVKSSRSDRRRSVSRDRDRSHSHSKRDKETQDRKPKRLSRRRSPYRRDSNRKRTEGRSRSKSPSRNSTDRRASHSKKPIYRPNNFREKERVVSAGRQTATAPEQIKQEISKTNAQMMAGQYRHANSSRLFYGQQGIAPTQRQAASYAPVPVRMQPPNTAGHAGQSGHAVTPGQHNYVPGGQVISYVPVQVMNMPPRGQPIPTQDSRTVVRSGDSATGGKRIVKLSRENSSKRHYY